MSVGRKRRAILIGRIWANHKCARFSQTVRWVRLDRKWVLSYGSFNILPPPIWREGAGSRFAALHTGSQKHTLFGLI